VVVCDCVTAFKPLAAMTLSTAVFRVWSCRPEPVLTLIRTPTFHLLPSATSLESRKSEVQSSQTPAAAALA
jgi:hypothetical protein